MNRGLIVQRGRVIDGGRRPRMVRSAVGELLEVRTVARAVVRSRSVAKDGTFTCRAVRYEDQPDDYGSIWSRGVFTKSLNRHMPTVCWAHQWDKIIGRAQSWKDTTEGPVVSSRLDIHPDVPLARQAAVQLDSGTITDVSVGFSNTKRRDPTDAERRRWPGVREIILEADLDEISLVLRGAVAGAQVL